MRLMCFHFLTYEPRHEISNNVVCIQQSLRSACAYAQSDQSFCLSLEYSMRVKLLTDHHLEFISLKGGCTDSTESTPVKLPFCWKLHVVAHIVFDCRSWPSFYSISRSTESSTIPSAVVCSLFHHTRFHRHRHTGINLFYKFFILKEIFKQLTHFPDFVHENKLKMQ